MHRFAISLTTRYLGGHMKLAIGITSIIVCTIFANLLLKIGAGGGESEKIFFRLLGWKSVLGLCFFGAAGILYAWVLKWLPLHVAQGIAAAQFMGVILVSWLVLSEPINAAQWLGIALIAAGIILTGWNYNPS